MAPAAVGSGMHPIRREAALRRAAPALVFVHLVADLDMPGDEFDFGDALAEIGNLDRVCAHHASIARWKAAATRAGLGKYDHSCACG